MGGDGADGGDRGGARGVGQVQVEEDAVGRVGGEGGAGLGEGGPGGEFEPQPGVVEELLHEQGVALVVLDEEDAVQRFVGGGAGGGCHGRAHRACSVSDRAAVSPVGGPGRCGGSGARVKVMRAPSRWSGSMAMVPPWNSTIFLHIASPMPLPE